MGSVFGPLYTATEAYSIIPLTIRFFQMRSWTFRVHLIDWLDDNVNARRRMTEQCAMIRKLRLNGNVIKCKAVVSNSRNLRITTSNCVRIEHCHLILSPSDLVLKTDQTWPHMIWFDNSDCFNWSPFRRSCSGAVQRHFVGLHLHNHKIDLLLLPFLCPLFLLIFLLIRFLLLFFFLILLLVRLLVLVLLLLPSSFCS